MFAVGAVAPNPARGAARLPLTLDADATVEAAVYDALGRRVAVVSDGPLAAGAHAIPLEAGALAPGVYVVRVVARPAGGGAARVGVRRLTVAR